MPNDLTQDQLQAALAPRPFQFHESVASSNDIAMQWLHNGAPQGAVVIADEQRQGRGRLGRVWYTPPGVAIAMSVILRPQPEHAGRISMMGAVVVAELCESVGIPDVGIKWPNDVQLGGRKVCGILPEAAWHNDALKGVVLGMGINVRVAFDDELKTIAANLERQAGQALNRATLIAYVLQRIDDWSPQLGTQALFEAWQARMNMLGKPVSINGINGQAHHVETDGALVIQQEDGTMQRVIAGDITFTNV